MKKLLILSGKGGTGKTTVAGAFIKLSNCDRFADCDVDAPNLHLITNIKDYSCVKSEYTGGKIAEIDANVCVGCGLCYDHCRFGAIERRSDGKYSVLQYSCEGCGVCTLVCPCGAVKFNDDVCGELFKYSGENKVFSTAELKMGKGNSGKLVTEVKEQLKGASVGNSNLQIVDGSPGIGCPVIASISGMDIVLIVAEPSVSGFSDLERLYKTVIISCTRMAVCVNKYDISIEKTEKIKEFCLQKEIPFVGEIPYDETVMTALENGQSVIEYDCPASKSIKDVYSNIIKYIYS